MAEIRVHYHKNIPGCGARPLHDRCGQSRLARLLLDQPNRMICRKRPDEILGPVGGPVIDKQDFAKSERR